MSIVQPPNLTAIADAPLRPLGAKKESVPAKELWKSAPTLLLVLRRPGCILCRAEAQKVYALKPKLDAMNVSLNCVVHENLPEEIAAFHPALWPGNLYLDETKALYRALNNGHLRKGSLLNFLNPWSTIWKHAKVAKETVKESNLKGDGLTMGGLMVVRRGEGGVEFAFAELNFGDHAEPAEILEACERASKS